MVRIEPGKGIGGRVLVSGEPFRTTNYAGDTRITKDYLERMLAEGMVAVLAVPIKSTERPEGVLYAYNRARRAFSDRDEATLLRLADQAAVAIRMPGSIRNSGHTGIPCGRCLPRSSPCVRKRLSEWPANCTTKWARR